MPIKRSSIKDVRRIERRTAHNTQIKKRLRDLSKDLQKAIASGQKNAVAPLLQNLQQTLDKAAKHNIIHRNAAGRKLSRAVRRAR